MNYKKPIVFSTFGLFILSVIIFLSLGRSFLPEFNEGSLTLSVITKPGTSLEISNDLGNLTEKELIDLNHRIVESLKFIESMRTHAEMLEFSVGDNVSFSPPGRDKVTGVLIKYNKKTVSILTKDGQKWNVSPRLLEREQEVKQKVKKSGNVVQINPKK